MVQDGCTPLHAACATGHTAVAELLIAKAVDVEAETAVRQLHEGSREAGKATIGWLA